MPSAVRSEYDVEARDFEARKGLPAPVPTEVARAIVEACELAPGDLLIEIGPGTGQIGKELVGLGLAYVALDASAAMLDQFRRALTDGQLAELVHADARERWPVADGAASAVFGSRSLHLLPAPHVAAELTRTASSRGSTLLAGRIVRAENDPRDRLRAEMRRIVSRAGAPRSGTAELERLLSACQKNGAEALSPRRVARFTRKFRIRDAIEGWAHKGKIATVALDEAGRRELCDKLEGWAAAEFGDIEATLESTEEYWLYGARLRAARA